MLGRASLSLVFAAGWAFAQKPAAPDVFRDQIQPILQKNCFGCHNAKIKQGGLDLSSREALLHGSEHGPVVAVGNPADSQLYKLVAHITEPAMPFKGKKLEDGAIAKISEWIKAGVPYGDAVIDPEAISRAEAEKHWAFRRPVRPVAPAVQRAGWSNPIDAFIAAAQEKRGLTAFPKRTNGHCCAGFTSIWQVYLLRSPPQPLFWPTRARKLTTRS